VSMIDDGIVKFMCILNFNIVASPTILTLADEVQSLFQRWKRETYVPHRHPTHLHGCQISFFAVFVIG
jgi:hypothetical protein